MLHRSCGLWVLRALPKAASLHPGNSVLPDLSTAQDRALRILSTSAMRSMQIIASGIGLAYPSAFKCLYSLTSYTGTIVPPNLLVPTSPILSRMSFPQTLALSLDEICLCLISSRAASISLLSTLSPINCMLQCCHEARAVGGLQDSPSSLPNYSSELQP